MKAQDTFDEISNLVERIGGSCSCGKKTPEPSAHHVDCQYRSIADRLHELEIQAREAHHRNA